MALLSARVAADEIAFFYALEADLAALKAEAPPVGQPLKVGARSIQRLRLGALTIHAVKMGSGVVETAVSAEALLARFQCDRAFSLGPVGGIAEMPEPPSWVRVGDVVPYQKGAWAPEGFSSAEKARSMANEKALAGLILPVLWQGVEKITVASGEIFIASSAYRAELQTATKAEAVDMNLYGLVTACANHQVPLVSWRVVSDRADDHASEDFQKFVATYNGAGGKALAAVIRKLPANPNSPESYPKLRELLGK